MSRLLAALACCSIFTPLAVAQEPVPPAPAMVADVAPKIFHSGWACLDAEGKIQGRVVTVGAAGATTAQANATVELFSKAGLVSKATTDKDGNFELAGVEPGVYGLTAAGESAFAAHAVQVLTHKPGMDDGVSVYATSMPRAQVDQILSSLFVPGTPTQPTYGPLQEPAMPIAQSQRVSLNDGVVNGRLAFSYGYGDPESHTIKVIQNGDIIDTVSVDKMGFFSFKAPAAGSYDLVVGGVGYGAVGIEVVADDVQLTKDGAGATFVAANAANLVQESVMVPVIMPETAGAVPMDEEIVGCCEPACVEEDLCPAAFGGGMPAGGGFYGGGGGGGGFGGGGIGGIAGLAGLAALGIGIAALADDDDGFNGNLATPIAP